MGGRERVTAIVFECQLVKVITTALDRLSRLLSVSPTVYTLLYSTCTECTGSL